MASVSIAARDSLRVSTVCLVKSHDRSPAVRKVHFLPMRTRLTPRVAYSALRRASASFKSTPSGSCLASVASSSGSPAANSKASSSRNSSGRAAGSTAGSSLWTIASFFAVLGMVSVSLCVFLRVMRRSVSIRADALAHVNRRERLFLMDFGDTLAHQFERGGKRGCKHRGRECRLHHIADQEAVDPRPVRRLPDQTLERGARFGQRPDRALLEAHARKQAALALRGISAEQIVERRRPFRPLDLGNRLRRAACEYVAIELRPSHQACRHLAERFQPAQTVGQRQRHIFCARSFAGCCFWQQQPRFQVSEPGRHHQIIGGKFEPQLPRRLDESEILIGQRQDRYFREIHFLLARQTKQQIVRALEALHVHDHGRLGGAAVGAKSPAKRGVEFVGVHEPVIRCDVGRSPASIWVKTLRAASTSNSSGADRAASAASARLAAAPVSSCACAATAVISPRSALQWSTTSHPAASAARLRSAIVPESAPIETSSLISKPWNPINPRITSCTIVTDVVAGATGSMAVNTTCAVMPSGRPASGRNAAKSVASRVARSVSMIGNLAWLSAVARPWPGRCLSTGRTPPACSPCAIAAAIAATLPGSMP